MIGEMGTDMLRPPRWVYVTAGVMALLLIASAAIIWPIRHRDLGVNGGLITILGTSVGLFDILTGLLLLVQFLVGHRRSGILIHMSYMWAGMFAFLYMATFPGSLAPHGLGEPATSTWAWVAWHTGMAILAIAYTVALAFEGDRAGLIPPAEVPRTIAAATAFLVGAGGLVAWVIVFHADRLPTIIKGRDFHAFTSSGIATVTLSLQFAALLALLVATRVRTVAHTWLAVSLLASLLDVGMAISVSIRGVVGWWAARSFCMVESFVLLVVLFGGVSAMYLRSQGAARAAI